MKTDTVEQGSKQESANGTNGATTAPVQEGASFAETALTLAGKSAEEARRTGAIDQADDDVDTMFKFRTSASPVHRAIWSREVPIDLFSRPATKPDADTQKVMDDSVATVERHRDSGTLYNDDGKIANQCLDDLGGDGYWGLLVDKQYGGSGCPFSAFAPYVTRMAMVEGTVAGLASVHGCIGAVDPVRTFGNEQQKQEYLPKLASGERLSAFALTEPDAGSDLTNLSTRAVLQGDEYVVNGEKLFITNVVPGRTIGLVCLVEDRPAVLIVDLPGEENDNFQLKKYGLYAIKGAYNRGIIFKDFRVPAKNLLDPGRGDGLTIAYHGLNLGRVSLCANAAGMMRMMMANMIPWAKYRVTYSMAIAKRELVQRRLGATAGLVVASDALVSWCSGLLDDGYRGEMECIVAKIFGSESQKHAAIEYFMKTHGGRSFLEGHIFGDSVHEFLAPCIYEGEGEMLGMAFFKSLVKEHGVKYFEPIGKALQKMGVKKPNLANPSHLMALAGPGSAYAKWKVGFMLSSAQYKLPAMPANLKEHADFAANFLQRSPGDISGMMVKHQLSLADRQCRMSELSSRIQDATTILTTAMYGAAQQDELVREAADIACQDITRRLTGSRPSDAYFRQVTKLGEAIADGKFSSINDIKAEDILMSYDQ